MTDDSRTTGPSESTDGRGEDSNKPQVLQAIEIILADPADIKKETLKLYGKYESSYGTSKSDTELQRMVVKKIISNYSYYTAFVGGATGLTGIVPGLGTVLAATGGAVADTALTMKYQIEMVMALAVVYGHDIENEEEQRLCMIVAGLGAINEATKQSGKAVGSKAFVSIVHQYLRGSTLVAVKQVFKKVGITFTRKGLEKAIPFGVGVVIGGAANKGLTLYVGSKARSFFEVS
jgi:hypothetical protein